MPTAHKTDNDVDNVAKLFDREISTSEEFVRARPLTALAAAIVFEVFIAGLLFDSLGARRPIRRKLHSRTTTARSPS